MKSKLVLLSLIAASVVPFTTRALGCPCEDKQVIAIVLNTNQAEIAVANSVLPRLSNPGVIAFAKKTIADHNTSNISLNKFSVDFGLPAEQVPLSQVVLTKASSEIQSFNALSGAALDKAYIDSETTDHQIALTGLDTYWVLKVINLDLKAWLINYRISLADHFAQAQALQKEINF